MVTARVWIFVLLGALSTIGEARRPRIIVRDEHTGEKRQVLENRSRACPTEGIKECIFPFKTVCTTARGPCMFPFLYKGKEYDKCTLYQSPPGRPWCATALKADGNMQQWADCDMEVCTDPHAFGGPYHTCVPSVTTEGKGWCATGVNEDGIFTTRDFCSNPACVPTPETTTTVKTIPRYPLTFDWVDSVNNQCWEMEPNGLAVSFNFNRFEITSKLGAPDDGWLLVSPSIGGVDKFCVWDESTYCKNPNEKCISPPKTHTFPADETVKVCYTALADVSSSFTPPNNGKSSSSSSSSTYHSNPSDVICWKNIALIGKSLKFELSQFLHNPSDGGFEWIPIGNESNTLGTTSIPSFSSFDMVTACFKSHPMDDGHSGFRVVLSQVNPLITTSTPNPKNQTDTITTNSPITKSTTTPDIKTSSETTPTTTVATIIKEKCADVVHELAQFYLNYGPQNKTDSPEECRALCKSVHACVGWSWNTRSTDCWLKAAMVEDTHVSGERDCEPIPIPIYNSSGGYAFYKVPVANGTTLVDGSVAKTCQKVNMTAVCNGGFDSTCPGNSHSCMTTDLSIDCGNSVMDELSKHICKENDPRNCFELEGVFSYKKGWFGGECGVVNGSYCALGKNHLSGDPVVYQALCVDCQSVNCSVNGGFSEWSSWSSCNKTCMRIRSRSCTNPETSNRGNGCVGKTYQEDPCTNADCPAVYNTNQTSGNYTTCPDGKCAYCGGDCAPTFIDLASNSTQNITVQCCRAGFLIDTTYTCGNGTSCKDICGLTNSSCITIVASDSAEEGQICSALMEEEDWCRSTTAIGELTGTTCNVGTRSILRGNKKTRAPGVTTTIININYCPRYVYRFMRNLGMMSNYKECCLHPTVHQHGILKNECSTYVGEY